MGGSLKQILLCLFFISIFYGAFAQSGPGAAQGGPGTENFPPINPDPRALDFFNRGAALRLQGRDFSWTDLAEISLWASGDAAVSMEGGEAGFSRLGQILTAAETIRSLPNLPSGQRERAEFVLAYMHSNILRTYSLYQTRVDTIFENGRYNCVYSAVLYMVLCMSLGIEASGVMTRDHAFVIVHIGGENIDVETTNALGFDPGNRREFHDQFGRATGFAYVPAQNYRDRQTISPIELISLIFQNRISEHERGRRFAEAIPLAVNRLALLSGEALAAPGSDVSAAGFFENPREYLLDRLLNYGASLLNSNREEESLRWAVYAAAQYPDESRWQELILAAVNNRMTRFIRANQLTEARAFLENQKPLLGGANFARLDSSLLDTELISRINRINNALEGDAIVNSVREAQREGRLTERRASEILVFAARRTASVLAAAPGRDWLAAIGYIENIIARFGPSRELEQDLQNYQRNRAADFHNRFAAEWNRRNYDEAERILNEGLAEFPNDRQLLINRDTLNRNRP